MREALRTVKDPEIPVNVVDLGLVYRLEIKEGGVVEADITLTSPACPLGPELVARAKEAIERVEGVREARVNLVTTPRWRPQMMSDRARRALEAMGFNLRL